MRTIFTDLKIGTRVLLRSKMFAFVAIVTLALAIGANTAIFTVVDAALLRGLPYRDSERLVHLWESHLKTGEQREASYPDFLDWKTQNQVFESVAGYNQASVSITENGQPEQLMAGVVTTNFFQTLGVETALGRTFVNDEEKNQEPSVILTHSLWQGRFAGDKNIIGRKISVSGQSFTIVGVLPRSFQFGPVGDAAMWFPLRPTQNQIERRYFHWLKVIAKLKPGVSMEQAKTNMATIGKIIEAGNQQYHKDRSVNVIGLQEQVVGQIKPLLMILLAAVGFLLLVACANVANLVLARSTARQKELAVRLALGASRWDLFKQFFSENLILTVIGGMLGLLLANWGVDFLIASIPASRLSSMPYLQNLTLDTRIILFTLSLSLLTSLVLSLIPTLQISKKDLQANLRDGGRSSLTPMRQRVRFALVVTEVALSLMLLIGSGLMIKSLVKLLQVNPGFDTENLLTFQLFLPLSKYDTPEKRMGFYQQLTDRLETLPGVKGVAKTNTLSLSGANGTGTPTILRDTNQQAPESVLRTVDDNYYQVMGIPLIKGRTFDSATDAMGKTPVVIVNQAFANRVFGGEQEALGQRMTFAFTANQPPFEIVGVVGNEKALSLEDVEKPMIYYAYSQSASSIMNVVVRYTSDQTSLSYAVRSEVGALDRDLPVASMRTMEKMIADSQSTFVRRYPMLLLSVFGIVAMLLAAIGIYGVLAYSVTQRTSEIGVRMALGANALDVFKLIIRQGMFCGLVGVGIGALASIALTRFLGGFLYGVSPTDPQVFIIVALSLLFISFMSCYIPARRATKVDPIVALKSE